MISVVMPAFNAEKYIREAIDSILNQTVTQFEFIIINDGSTDQTENIILSYSDPRIRYIKNKTNLQIVKTLNKGVKLAKGEYIARMDADDISLPERFERQLKFMEEHPDIDVCGTWIQSFGYKNKVWGTPISHEEIKISLLFNCAISHPSVLMKRDIFEEFKYSEEYNKAEDYYLWVELVNSKVFFNIPEVLLKYRTHTEQTNKVIQGVARDKVREVMLNNLGCSLNSQELESFFTIANYEPVSLHNVDFIFTKIIEANERSLYFDRTILIQNISQRFLALINENTDKGFSVLILFLKSSTRHYMKLPWMSYIKLIIKCTIKYY